MPTESVNQINEGNPYFVDYWKERNWISSQRINGKLVLRNNPYTYLSGKYTRPRKYPAGYHSWLPSRPPNGSDVPLAVHKQYAIRSLEEKCYQKVRRKLYKGSAAFGVTLGSMKQSKEMVEERLDTIRTKGASAFARLASVERRRGLYHTKTLETAASVHLEIIFGWTPLLADIVAGCTSVIQLSDVHTFISVAQNATGNVRTGNDHYATRSRVAVSTGVRITNPNRWLAERAGLLNPATVAWDLVPWSFVVNMFVNTGQLVQSITDFAGLEFKDMMQTTTQQYWCERAVTSGNIVVSSGWTGYDKRRKEASLRPPRSLTFRLPDANWDTAAMAASLMIQQFTKVATKLGPYTYILQKRGLRGLR